MSDARTPRIEIRVYSARTWVVQCLTCGRTLGRQIAGDAADLVGKLATTHHCPALQPQAGG